MVTSRLTLQNLGRIVNFAAENQLPLAGGFGAWAKQHGLLSYGPNVDDMTRRAVAYIDRILKGTKPADLPVQQPVRTGDQPSLFHLYHEIPCNRTIFGATPIY